MDDLAQQLNQILSDPQSMQQIQGIMNSLGMNGGEKQEGNGASSAPSSPPGPSAPNRQQNQPASGGLDPSALTGVLNALGMGGNQNTPASQQSALGPLGGTSLGGITPEMLGMVTRLAPLLNQVNREDDSTRLLHALRPLLSPPRQKKVDEAMKILQMMRLLPLLKESGVFSSLLSGLI